MTSLRYGVVSDVHGNLHALRTVLSLLDSLGIDRLLSVGDAIGYGPQPVECVELLAARNPVSVVGNHELMALGQMSSEHCTSTARESLAWTRTTLTTEARQILADQPMVATAPGVVLAHGSLERPDEYVRSSARADEQLDRMVADHPDARVLVLGHTHEAWAYGREAGTLLKERPGRVEIDAGAPMLLNPGSVGQSRDRHAHARFAVLDLGQGVADFYSVPYDHRGCQEALRARGLPSGWCHIVPPLRERLRSVVGETLRWAHR